MIYGLEPLRWGTFCKSKIVCAEIKGEYVLCFTLYRCRRATGKGRLCFINRKGKTFISDIRVFVMENVCFFRFEKGWSKSRGLSFDFSLVLYVISVLFLRNRVRFYLCCLQLSLTRVSVLRRTRACASRTQRVDNSYLHPSPSPLID